MASRTGATWHGAGLEVWCFLDAACCSAVSAFRPPACAGGYKLVQAGTLPGKYALDRLLSYVMAPQAASSPLPSALSVSFTGLRHQNVQIGMVARWAYSDQLPGGGGAARLRK